MTAQELLKQALHVQADLDELSRSLEETRCRPEVRSRMARDVTESRARILAVIEACTPPVYVAVAEASRPAP